jgi:hypothetical protein
MFLDAPYRPLSPELVSFFSGANQEEQLLLRQLRFRRNGYEMERYLHNFLLDSYVGGGGFQNALIPSPDAPFWGRRAYERGVDSWLYLRQNLFNMSYGRQGVAAQQSMLSYLVAYTGEDQWSYLDRIKNTAYINPVERIVRVTNSFLFQDEPERRNIPKELERWAMRVDGRERELSSLMRNVGLRTQIFGWSGVLLDLPTESTHVSTPYAIPIVPQEITDWDMRPDGSLAACALSFMHEHPRRTLSDVKLWEEHVYRLYPDHWEKYVILLPPPNAGPLSPLQQLGRLYSRSEGPNPLSSGRLPVAFASWDEGFGALTSFGLPQIFNVAKAAWEMFQMNSERRSIMRGQTFATLVTGESDASTNGNIGIGVGNYITEKKDHKGLTRYIAPPNGPAEIYAKAFDSMMENLHTISGLDLNSRRYSETAEAMNIRFQQMEAMLQNAAKNLEACERDIFSKIGEMYSIKDSVLDQVVIKRSKVFNVSRYRDHLDETKKAMSMPWGKKVLTRIFQRCMRGVIPNSTEVELAELDAEIAAEVEKNHDRFLDLVFDTSSTTTTATSSPKPKEGTP